jgi:mRNA-degrading endonuclease RelE of RelBE toxin-antitoxin system
MYGLIYTKQYQTQFYKLDKSVRINIFNKLPELLTDKKFKRLKYFNVGILKVGQYRVGFLDKEEKRILLFVGTHKEYEEWYSKQTKERLLEILKEY